MAAGETIIFTYDVSWKESDTHWASRWDIYLTMNHAVKNRVGFLFVFRVNFGDSLRVASYLVRTYYIPGVWYFFLRSKLLCRILAIVG